MNAPIDYIKIILKCFLAVVIPVIIFALILCYFDQQIPKKYKNSICSLCNKPGVNLVFNSCGTHYFHRECVLANSNVNTMAYCPTCSKISTYKSLFCKECGWKKDDRVYYTDKLDKRTDLCTSCVKKEKKQ